MNRIQPKMPSLLVPGRDGSGPLASARRRRRARRGTAELRASFGDVRGSATTVPRLLGPTRERAPERPGPESSGNEERQPLLGAGEILAGKYRIEGLLGRGGMGTVYAAVHLDLGLPVAIKVPHQASQDARARLIREARTCALFASHHIPRVFDLGQVANGAPFIVMERLEGEDLAHLIARGPVRPENVVSYVRQACAALSDAHAAGVVHRDLKPANLFLTKPKRTRQALLKVLDFGISKRLFAGSSTDLSVTGAHLGSPQYMSPEQIRGKRDVDQRTDIWSLGVIFYELLTGKPPFCGSTLFALSVAIATETPLAPSHGRDLPAGLEGIVLRCLEKDPAARFASAKDLMRAVKPFL